MGVKMEREIRRVHVLRLNRRSTVASATDREILSESGGGSEIKNLKLNKMNFIVK